jgi:hypothetical protein
MTEAEWLTCADPEPMLAYLRGTASDRKLRLFACSCCRRVWALLIDPASRAAVEFSEAHADAGLRGRRGFPAVRRAAHLALRAAQRAAEGAGPEARHAVQARVLAAYAVDGLTAPVQAAAVANNLARAIRVLRGVALRSGACPEQEQQAGLVREQFGNPFRCVAVEPQWLSSDVVALARGIHAEGAFDRLPILADALQEAGCEEGPLLAHCRGPGPHARGCWAVDLLLGLG